MTPNPHDMLLFLEVVETRGFTAAARSTGLTKSAVSQAVRRLEDAVGQQLLFRTTRALSLTDAGARLLFHCRALRKVQQATLEDVAKGGGSLRETLTVTAPHALCGPVLVPALQRFLSDRKIALHLIAEDAPVNLVERQIDVAIRVGAKGPQSALVSRIGWLTESLYAHRAYVTARGGAPAALSDLSGWAHIANEWQGQPIVYESPNGHMISVAPEIRCNTVLDVMSFVRRGFGVALLPDIAVDAEDDRRQLIRLFPIGKTEILSMHNYGVRPPAKVRDFVAFVRAALNQAAPNARV